MSQRLGPGGGPGAQSVVGGTRWPLPRQVTFQGPLPGARLVQKGVCLPSWSLLFPDWPHPASPASIPRPGRRLCRGERDTRPPALPAGWCQVFTWGELSAGAWFPELAAGTGHAPPRAPPRWGMAVGPSPSGAASVTCGPQRSIQGPHLRMEGIQEAAWEKEREDAFVGPGSSERPELRAAARGRGWRVGGTARVRPPARGDGGLCSEPARAEHLSLVGPQRGRCRRGRGWRGPAHAGASSARVCRALQSPRRVMRRGARGHSSRGRSGQSKAGRAQGSGGPWDRGSPARYSQDW